MKKAVVTGANSFIGYRLCRILAENGYYVFAVIRKDNIHNAVLESSNNIRIIYCEMREYESLDFRIKVKCDVGIALAWNGTRGTDRNDARVQKANLLYSLDGVDAFIRLGCKKIVTSGSQAEYGLWFENRKVTEEDKCNPNTEYGRYKIAFYEKTLAICETKKITLIEPRFFSLYGDDDSEKTMIVSMTRNMLLDKPCELTECVQLWDFLYIDDAVSALCILIESESACGIYNFGSGLSKPLKDYVLEMAELVHTKSELKFGAVPYPETGIVNTNPSVERLMRETGWKPVIAFTKGIKKVIERQSELIAHLQ